MARFLNHSYPGRKALLFVVEQGAVAAAALLGAATTAALVAGAAVQGGEAPLPRILSALAQGPLAAQQVAGQIALALTAAVLLRIPDALPWAVGAAGICAATLYVADLYDLRRAVADRSGGGRRTLTALLAVLVVLFAFAVPGGLESRAQALGAALASAAAVVALRAALPALVGRPLRLLVVGDGDAASRFSDSLRDSEYRVEVAGRIPLGGRGARGLVEEARRLRADLIVVALADGRGRLPSEELVDARAAGIPCLSQAQAAERFLRRIPVEELRPADLAFSDGFGRSLFQRVTKRCIDVAGSLVGLMLAAPLLALAAAAIRLDSPGPIFYSQERVGKGGRTFRIFKLRSMRMDAESSGMPRWAQADDPRITRVGRILRKTRIDEIPQLVSVLRGDMSLVGPRPERPYFVERLKPQIPFYGLREAAVPGVTGWAQIRYPYGSSEEDARRKLEFDLYYLKNGSVFLDLAILFHTVRHVLTGRGAR